MKVKTTIPAQYIREQDTLTIVRICIKMSDALVDCDTLEYIAKAGNSNRYKRDVKRSISNWSKYIDEFSSRFLVPFMNANEEVCISLTTQFRDLSDGIEFDDEETTAIILTYAKCVSILKDLDSMMYSDPLIQKLWNLTRRVVAEVEKTDSVLFNLQCKTGHNTKDLIKVFDLLGNKIMYRQDE